MSTTYWMADAEYIGVCYNTRQWLIGEDENAEWWVIRYDDSWIRFNRWHPLHWLCYWNSRRRNQVVFLFG